MGISLKFWKKKSTADKAAEKVSKLPVIKKIIGLVLLILVLSFGVSAGSFFLYNKYFVTPALDKAKEGVTACGKFAAYYGLFYEKAAELFVNGTTGCAIKYLESNEPYNMTKGCYKSDEKRYRPIDGDFSKAWSPPDGYHYWNQDPDPKYYNSLKELYDQATGAREACESVAGEVGISF